MPIILSPIISDKLPPLWGEGAVYKKEVIYDINSSDPKQAPVHYNAYTLKPHSMPHTDAPGHIIAGGCDIDWFYENKKLQGFYGRIAVVRLEGSKFKKIEGSSNQYHWEVTKNELVDHLVKLNIKSPPNRLLLSVEDYPQGAEGTHDPNYALTLSEEAANFLTTNADFCTFGTSWKSTDYQPGKRERPIHKIFLSKKITIFECLDMRNVRSGEFILMAFPLPLRAATESPVCPVLFEIDELVAMIENL